MPSGADSGQWWPHLFRRPLISLPLAVMSFHCQHSQPEGHIQHIHISNYKVFVGLEVRIIKSSHCKPLLTASNLFVLKDTAITPTSTRIFVSDLCYLFSTIQGHPWFLSLPRSCLASQVCSLPCPAIPTIPDQMLEQGNPVEFSLMMETVSIRASQCDSLLLSMAVQHWIVWES